MRGRPSRALPARCVAHDPARFSIGEARGLVADLFTYNPLLYWTDLLVSLTIGYTAAVVYLHAPLFSPLQLTSFLVCGFALFRAGSHVHEIAHMRAGEMLGFRIGWNVLCGIPMLMPSHFYENHIDHHNSHHYGTEHDGEYLPLGSRAAARISLVLRPDSAAAGLCGAAACCCRRSRSCIRACAPGCSSTCRAS